MAEYLSGQPAPVDEEEFDRFLLAGKDLATDVQDVGELEIAQTEGVASVDPTLGADIDYHEDFTSLNGVGLTLGSG